MGTGRGPRAWDGALRTQKWEETETRGPKGGTESGGWGEARGSGSNIDRRPKAGGAGEAGRGARRATDDRDPPGPERQEAAAAPSADPCDSPHSTPRRAFRPSRVARLSPGPLLPSAACLPASPDPD